MRSSSSAARAREGYWDWGRFANKFDDITRFDRKSTKKPRLVNDAFTLLSRSVCTVFGLKVETLPFLETRQLTSSTPPDLSRLVNPCLKTQEFLNLIAIKGVRGRKVPVPLGISPFGTDFKVEIRPFGKTQMFLIESSTRSAHSGPELIAEKITLPSQAPRLSRSRLLELLEKSLRTCTSTVISGRAGTGKTALALDLARSCGRQVTWYKVDAPEADLESFFHYLIASIRQARPRFGTEALIPLLRTAGPDQVHRLAEAFVYELVEGETKPLLVVIEDLHLVCDAEWLVPFFRRLLPLLPAEVHMLITSRTLPPAPLWRMRSKQTLSVIEEDTLAFSRQEAIELFEGYGLSSEHATIALDHTQGRAAALTRFAASLNGSEKRFPGQRLLADTPI
jgi:AAA ATPase domain